MNNNRIGGDRVMLPFSVMLVSGQTQVPQSGLHIHPRHLRDIVEQYSYIRLRIRFLLWEVNIELLEMFAASSMWITFVDMVNLLASHRHNTLYDMAFHMVPPLSCAVIAGAICVVHLAAILMDQSGSNSKDLTHLRVRHLCMAASFIYLLGMTLSMFFAAGYALAWKYLARDTIAAWFSHIRLRKQYTRLKRKQVMKDDATAG